MSGKSITDELAAGSQNITVLPASREKKLQRRYDRSRAARGPELAQLVSVRKELGKVYRECRRGKLPSEDGSRLTFMLTSLFKMLETEELLARVEQLEARHGITWNN
jgi:hypothetical protein